MLPKLEHEALVNNPCQSLNNYLLSIRTLFLIISFLIVWGI